MSDARAAQEAPRTAFRKELSGVRFLVDARIAQGTMTVRDLLDLVPGTVVRAATPAGATVLLCVSRVCLATAEPFVEEGKLVVRIVRIEPNDA